VLHLGAHAAGEARSADATAHDWTAHAPNAGRLSANLRAPRRRVVRGGHLLRQWNDRTPEARRGCRRRRSTVPDHVALYPKGTPMPKLRNGLPPRAHRKAWTLRARRPRG